MKPKTKLRPSASARWLSCPGSIEFEREHGVDDPTPAAQLGTHRHYLAAEHLLGIMSEDDIEPDDWDLIEYYVSQVETQAKDAELFWVERTFEHGCLVGTPDAVIVTADRELQIHDMKFAFGRPVEADGNTQLLCYALLAARSVDNKLFDRVRLLIHQGNSTDEWLLDPWLPVISEFSDRVRRVVEMLNEPGKPPRTPSPEACHYCTARAACPELAAYVKRTTTIEEDHNEKQNAVEIVRRWADAVESKTYAMLQAGEEIKDWKLVAGRRPPRAWSSCDEAEAALKSCRLKADEMYVKKLIGPAPAEKLLKQRPRSWAKIEPLIVQGDAKPTIAKKADKRPAIVPSQDFFEDLTTDD